MLIPPIDLQGGQIVVRQVDRVDLTTVPGSQGGESVFLSADGSHIGFRRERELYHRLFVVA